MPTTTFHPEPFGIATVAADLDAARRFYTSMFPFPVIEGVFAGIKYFSIMKGGVTLVNVFERSEANPITGMIPILKVNSVPDYLAFLRDLGGNTIIPQSICPCTNTNFAMCQDREGNQFLIKEPTAATGSAG